MGCVGYLATKWSNNKEQTKTYVQKMLHHEADLERRDGKLYIVLRQRKNKRLVAQIDQTVDPHELAEGDVEPAEPHELGAVRGSPWHSVPARR